MAKKKDDETINEDVETNEEDQEVDEEEAAKDLLSKEGVQKMIEDARKQEKDKLYSTIDELKGTVKNLASKLEKEEEEKVAAKKEAKDKADKERLASLSESEQLNEQLKKFEEQLVNERKAREELQEEARAEREMRLLEEYKKELIADAEGKIIPELVNGGSREEIEQNAAVAKTRYQEFFQAAYDQAKGKKNEVGKDMPNPTDPDPASLEEEELKGVVRPDMSIEDYEKNREEILSQVERAYRRSLNS